MKRKRNADDALRAAERKAFETGEPADRARYWKLALRAGVLPRVTTVAVEGPYFSWWHLGSTGSLKEPWYGRVFKNGYPYSMLQFVPARGEIPERVPYNEKVLAGYLNQLLDDYEELSKKQNPRRLNADDRLRKLERAAASGDPKDLAVFWRAQIQAGITPEHTIDISNEAGNRRMQVWSILLRPSGGYTVMDPRVILRSRLNFQHGKYVWTPAMITKWAGRSFRENWDKQVDFSEPDEVRQLLHQTLLEHIDENS